MKTVTEIIAIPPMTLPAMTPAFDLLLPEGGVVGRSEEVAVVACGEPPVGVVVKDPGKPTVPPGSTSGLSKRGRCEAAKKKRKVEIGFLPPIVIDSMESQIFPD